MKQLLPMPTWILAAIGVMIVVQLSLQVFAIVDLVKREADRLTLAKWLWAVIIVFGEILGPILYLLAGRKAAPAVEAAPAMPVADRADTALDALYGRPEDGDKA